MHYRGQTNPFHHEAGTAIGIDQTMPSDEKRIADGGNPASHEEAMMPNRLYRIYIHWPNRNTQNRRNSGRIYSHSQ